MTPPDAEADADTSWQERSGGVNDFLARVKALGREYHAIKPTRYVVDEDDGLARVPIYYREKRARRRALVRQMLALHAELDGKYPRRSSRHAAPAPATEPVTLFPEQTQP